MSEKVYLVGAGPGNPELLTLKAHRLLGAAEVIVYDRLVGPEILALANPRARLLYAGKHGGDQERVQTWILHQLLAFSRRGQTVVRLKGGDPCVFGRGGDEWQFLRSHGIEVEVVPGLTSAVAAPTAAGIPLTHRGLSRAFTVVTGHRHEEAPTDWSRYAGVDTLVILMAVAERAAIARELIAAGRPAAEPVAFLEKATTPGERVIVATLDDVAQGRVEVGAPAVFVVGWVVTLRDQLVANAQQTVLAEPQPPAYAHFLAGD